MRKILIVLLAAVSLVACSDDDTTVNNTSPTGGTANPLDVGSVVQNNFSQTDQAPTPTGCDSNGADQFDQRVQKGTSWQIVRAKAEPGLTANQTLNFVVTNVNNNSVNLEGSTEVAVTGGPEQKANFTAVAHKTGGDPVPKGVTQQDEQALDEINKIDQEDLCEFQEQGQAQTDVKNGSFKMENGQEVQQAQLQTEISKGTWQCKDDLGNVTQQEDNAQQVKQTVSTYEIPGFTAIRGCEPAPIYVYISIVNKNNNVVESEKTEIQSVVVPVVTPTPSPSPSASPSPTPSASPSPSPTATP
jgi:hypothetical protein